MRILQINNCHYRRGGADVVYLNTGDLLEKKGHDVFYFSQKNENNYPAKSDRFFIESIDFFNRSLFQKINLIPRFFYSKEAAAKLKELIKECKPQIAHIHTYKGTLTPSILKVLKKAKIPIVITLHDYGLICPHNSFLNGKGQICTKCFDTGNSIHCIINKCNRNSLLLSIGSFLEYNAHRFFSPFNKYFDHLIAVCKFSYVLHSQISRYSHKISQLYNFTPLLNNNVSFLKRGEYFLFYGRLSKEKGLETLLKSFICLPKKIKLKILGDGPLKEELMLFASENDLSNIEFIDFRQNNELIEIIRNSFFIIVPSEVNENNPMTIVESYSLGKPVIGSRVGGIPEILLDGQTGYVFESYNSFQLRDAIEKAFSITNEEYFLMSKNAHEFAKIYFSEEVHYNKLLEIYNKVLSE